MHDAEVNKVISNCDSISCKEVSSQLTCDFPTEPSGVTLKKLTRDITFFTPKKFAFIIKETAKCYWDKIEKIKNKLTANQEGTRIHSTQQKLTCHYFLAQGHYLLFV